MKLIMKKILVILMIICTLFPMLFSNISLAEDSILLTTERAGNYAATFAINFFQNWSSVNYYEDEEMKNISSSSNSDFVWPLEGFDENNDITSEFGPRSIDNHKGMDLARSIGTNIYSCSDGTVISAYSSCTHNYGKQDSNGNISSCYDENGQRCGGGYGNNIRIDCGNDVIILYGHLTDVNVKVGDSVKQGQLIGTMGTTGMSSGSHLHLEFMTNNISNLDKSEYQTNGFGSYSVNPRIYIEGNAILTNTSSSSSSIKSYGEIKTSYNDAASEIDNPVQAEDEQYIFSNKSWIDFVFKNSLALENTSYYPSSDYSSNEYYEKIGEDSDLDGEILDITELVNSGKILPGDILYTTQHEYLLYVGGTQVIFAQEPYSDEGALKYEYLQTYLKKVKNKLLNANIDNPEYELEAYGVTDVYRVKQELIATASIKENTQNLFFNNKGYYDPNTEYSGIPVKGNYDGTTHTSLFRFIIKCIEDIFVFLINLIFYAVRAVIVGWVSIVESLIQSIILKLSGNTAQLALASQNTGLSATSYSDGQISVESLFFNKIPITDANFFNFESAGGYLLKDENGNPTMLYILKQNLAMWYIIIRNLSIAIMLFILLYIGIRMALTTIAEKKADYKKSLMNWVQALAIVMFIHFFMYLVFYLNDNLVQLLQKLSYMSAANILGGNITEISLYEAIRTKAYAFNFSEGTTGMVLYIIMVYLLLRFLLIYLKRAISIYVLGMMGSFMGVKYAFDKANGKKTTSLGNWMKDFAFNVLLQSIHCLMYVLLMSVALSTASESVGGALVAIIIIQLMLQSDKIFMKIFGISAKGGLLEDVDKPESYFTLLGKAKIITGIAEKTFGFGKDIVTGKNWFAEQIKMAYYANPEDDMKTAKKKVEMARLSRIGARAVRLDKIAHNRWLPIRLLQRFTRTDRQRRYRLLAKNLSYEDKINIYGNLQKEKDLKKQHYTRHINSIKNLATGTARTIAGVGLLAEGFAPAMHSMKTGVSTLYNEFDPKTAKMYKRTRANEKYLPGILGDLQIKDNIHNEKYDKDMKKLQGKQDALEQISVYDENINNTIEELKSGITGANKEAELAELLNYFKETAKSTNKSNISAYKIQKAVNRYMYSNDKLKLKDSDFDGLMDELQQVLDENTNNKIDVGKTATRRAELRASFSGISLEGLDSKAASTLIVENINKPNIIKIPKLNSAIDVDIQDKLKLISDNLKNIYAINQKSVIQNKGTAEDYRSVLKEYVKKLKEV